MTTIIVYQLGGPIAGTVSFILWVVMVLALLARILCLLFRRGYGRKSTQSLSSVSAAK